ncbi:hypothetical protein PC39_05510 [Salinisphaera sp. PC39]|uniref:hemerythrin domain-containing protein n=1 Tax=Salinisphaera sp. PC39 TaxID=1304156 RepID=UPI003342BBAE
MADDILQLLRREHRNLAGLLHVLDRQRHALNADDTPDYDLMRQIVRYLDGDGGSDHLPLEEQVFEQVLARRPALGARTARLAADHERLRRRGRALIDAADSVLSGQPVRRADLVSLAGVFVADYREHLCREDNEVFRPLEASLAPDERRALTAALPDAAGAGNDHEYRALADRLIVQGAGPAAWAGTARATCPVCSQG